jgi:hypothetical protein
LKFTGLLASNSAAKAWCADAADVHPNIARPMIPTAKLSFVRIDFLLLLTAVTQLSMQGY